MCIVSYVGDYYRDQFPKRFPREPWQIPGWPAKTEEAPGVSRQEFDQLRKQVEEMLDLMRKAKEIDDKTGQPDCEMDEKLELLKKIAATVGVDLIAGLRQNVAPG